MSTGTYRGKVRGKLVVLEGDIPLEDGTEVLVTAVSPQPGTGGAVVAAMKAEPQVPREWVDELEKLIEEGQRPPLQGDPFAGAFEDGRALDADRPA
jgi:hypothetical protein